MYADLHVHSWHSDGTLSPAQIVEAAKKNGVGLLAVADHELIEGSAEAAPLCKAAGIGFLRAVELESRWEGRCYHILAYNPDFADAAFLGLARENRRRLDAMSDRLIERMAAAGEAVSVADYRAFERDPALGGWKGLHYLMARGLTASLRGGIPFYGRYGVTYDAAGFPQAERVIAAIHAAGGRAVLAHPGEVVVGGYKEARPLDPAAFARELARMADLGLDGVECYYPTHAPQVTQICLDFCRARKLMITAGSDCHGAFGTARVGEMNIAPEQLDLRGLTIL